MELVSGRAQQGHRRVQLDHEDAGLKPSTAPASSGASATDPRFTVAQRTHRHHRRRRARARRHRARHAGCPSRRYTPLFSGCPASDASAVVAQLAKDKVAYQLTDGGGTILVPRPTGLRRAPQGRIRRPADLRAPAATRCSTTWASPRQRVPAERHLQARHRGRAREDDRRHERRRLGVRAAGDPAADGLHGQEAGPDRLRVRERDASRSRPTRCRRSCTSSRRPTRG